jgi:hypothetical protein
MVAAVALMGMPGTVPAPAFAASCGVPTVDMKILVLAADGGEVDLPWIKQALELNAVPYTVYQAAPQPPLPSTDRLAALLADLPSCHAFFQGVILTTGSLSYTPNGGVTWMSALTTTEWQTLHSFETNFGVREISWYTYPNADYGFQAPSGTTGNPTATTLTAAGRAVFPYINSANPITVANSYIYLARTDATGTPLLVDSAGNALMASKTYTGGRQSIALTFATSQYVLAIQVLSTGLINWVGNGLILGERHVYLDPQVDDFFIDDREWVPNATTGPCPSNPDDPSMPTYRLNAQDMNFVRSWQAARQAQPTTQQLAFEMAFNAYGTSPDYPLTNPPDTLVPQTLIDQGRYKWITHTWDHQELDNINYNDAMSELQQNDDAATGTLNLTRYSRQSMVTPSISGFNNSRFMQAAWDFGIRYLVGDTSRPPPYSSTVANTGNYSQLQPGIMIIPRHPVNLYFNVSTPSEWTGEYNCFYRSFWGRDLSYAEILDKTSDTLVGYLVSGDNNPLMFHQPNLRAYDGAHSLLTDLLDVTLQKYNAQLTLPIVSLAENEIGQRMADRMSYNAAGLRASFRPGQSITLTVQNAARIPLTGRSLTCSACTTEVYGGVPITYVTMSSGQSLTIPLA